MGDKLLKIDDFEITPTTAVDEVRNHLRGDPGTSVSITFLREGVGGKVNEPQTIELQRSVVRIPDVKYFGFVGDPRDGIGYIDLSGFANDAGREVRFAIKALQHGASEIAAANGAARDDSGMVATDPTSLKVCSSCLIYLVAMSALLSCFSAILYRGLSLICAAIQVDCSLQQ